MAIRIVLSAALLAASVSACATYPASHAEQGGARAALYFPKAPEDAQVLVDGVPAGFALQYDGRKAVLVIEPGRHQVVVNAASGTLYNQPVYVGAGSRIAIRVAP